MKAAGVIFDLDGTLLDSMGIWSEIGGNYLKSLGHKPKDTLREDTRALSLFQAAEYMKENYYLIESTDEIMASINKMISNYYYNTIEPKEGARELLEYLKTNDMPLSLATATASHLVEAALDRLDFRKYFKSIYSCVDVGKGKDDPEIFILAQNSLGTPRRNTWVFEDALYAATTAKDAGFTVVGVHDQSAEAHQDELKALSHHYIGNLTQGRELFKLF